MDLRIVNGTSKSDQQGEFTYMKGKHRSVIDFCCIGGDWCSIFLDFKVDSFPYSDHLPIVASITLEGIEVETMRVIQLLPKYVWSNSMAETYRLNTNILLSQRPISSMSTLEEIIKLSIPVQTPSGNKKHNEIFKSQWFYKECLKARQKTFAFLRLFRKFNTATFHELYNIASCNYKNICRAKKKEYWESEAKKLANCYNATDFWNAANKIKGVKPKVNIELTAETLKTHFQNHLSSPSKNSNFLFCRPNFFNETLDNPITIFEVEEALAKAKDLKAPGLDRIPMEFYKYGSDELKIALTEAFNKIFESGVVPIEFKKAIIYPIFKKGDSSDPTNYRGISILNSSAKIFTTILQNRLERWINENKLLKEFQAGFRPGYATVDHIFMLRNIAESYIAKKQKLYAFFIDFKAAFDTIDRKKMFYKLYSYGLSRKFGITLENLYDGTKSAVWSGNDLSEWFTTKSGVRQGCNTSPVIFALYIEDFIDHLSGGITFAEMHIKALLYVDDIVILAKSPESLQMMINRVAEYCDLWDLQLNLNKSKIMIFKSGGGRMARSEKWVFKSEPIEIVKQYKYLGMIFTPSLNMETHFDEKLTQAKYAISATWRNCFQSSKIAHSAKYKIFEAVAKSILFYGAQTWGHLYFDKVEKLLRYYLRRTFLLPGYSPNYMLMIETGMSALFIQTLKLNINYILKAINMEVDRLPRKLIYFAVTNYTLWYKDILELAESYDYPLQLNWDSKIHWKRILYNFIDHIDVKMRYKWREDAKSSTHREIYKTLEFSLGHDNYFKDCHNTQKISHIFRARGEVLPLNYVPHRNDLPIFCSICNMVKREDSIHFIGVCPAFKDIRRSCFGKSYLTAEEVKNALNGPDWEAIHKFCITALNYRKMIINEDF